MVWRAVHLAFLTAIRVGTQADDTWGPEHEGLRAALHVGPRKDLDFHPGEYADVHLSLKNAAKQPLKVGIDQWTHIHLRVTTPLKKELTYAPWSWKRGTREKPPPPRENPQEFAAGIEWSGATTGWPWTTLGPGHIEAWRDAKSDEPAEQVPFRTPGAYSIQAIVRVGRPEGGAGESWFGTLESNVVELKVAELPVEKRLMKVTAAQAEALRTYLQMGTLSAAWSTLERDIRLTENEGLALAVLEAAKGERDELRRKNLIYLLSMRAAIDGPTLKPAVDFALDDAAIDTGGISYCNGLVDEYLSRHDDKAVKRRLITAAEKLCRPAELFAKRGYGDPGDQAISWAWHVLIQCGVLKEGMSFTAAEKLLGPATTQSEDWATWAYPSHSRRVPALQMKVRDGKVVQIKG